MLGLVSSRCTSATRALVFFACVCWQGSTQIFKLENVTVPAELSLESIYAFYVDTVEDHESSSALGTGPYVQFTNVEVFKMPGSGVSETLPKESAIQVSLLSAEKFHDLLLDDSFCNNGRLFLQKPKGNDAVLGFTELAEWSNTAGQLPRDGRPRNHEIPKRGIYFLTVSNCFDTDIGHLTVSGTVEVQHTHGYLPGYELSKHNCYMALSLVYGVVCVVWLVLLAKRKEHAMAIQLSTAFCFFLALCDCSSWVYFLQLWNSTGTYSCGLLSIATYFSAMKQAYLLMLFFTVNSQAMGWDVTKQETSSCGHFRFLVIAVLLFGSFEIQEIVHFHSRAYLLSPSFLLLVLVPIWFCSGSVCMLSCVSFGSTIQTLEERREKDKLQLISRLRSTLFITLLLALLAQLYQLLCSYQGIHAEWRHDWVATVVVPHGIFLISSIAFAMLVLPQAADTTSYTPVTYDPDADDVEVAEVRNVHQLEEFDEDEETGESLTLNETAELELSTAVQPEQIGAANGHHSGEARQVDLLD